MQKFTEQEKINFIKNNIEDIRDFSHICKITSNDIWGKCVKRFKEVNDGTYEDEEYELEDWKVSYPICVEEFEPDKVIEQLKYACLNYELSRVSEVCSPSSQEELNKISIHQLCDWQVVEPVKNGWLTLVKYARVLKD